MRGTIGARCLCWHYCRIFGTEDQESFWLLSRQSLCVEKRIASYSRGRDDSHDSGKRRKDITAGVARRKRTQSGEEDFTMPCDSSQLDTSCVNTSKRLCTSKYFSPPEDCNDVDISFSYKCFYHIAAPSQKL